PMTLRYASPEQVRMEGMTTASDVYSLGVLLYELLVGESPYRTRTDRREEMAEAVCEQEPRRPSTVVSLRRPGAGPPARKLRRQLKGDLDSIVLKALRKELAERYSSAEQLAEDLERYLEGLPVRARRGNWTYLAGKFIRRHGLVLAAVTAFVGLSLAFGLISDRFREHAVAAQATAEVERERAAATTDFLKRLFRTADPDAENGRALSAEDVLRRGKAQLLGRRLDDPVLEAEIAGTLGELFRDLGYRRDARDLMERSVAAVESVYPSPHEEVAKRLQNLAVLLYDDGDFAAAETIYRRVLAMRLELVQPESRLFRLKSNLATTLMQLGKLAEAERLHREVFERRRQLYEARYGSDDPDLATSRHNLAAVLLEKGELR
ncbi:MAG: tetratricopeptide repeat protein, partial [Acidobacteria bacterium]|nr:tetratricopeptide repeat protein [Acidobacteriota bacterium]